MRSRSGKQIRQIGITFPISGFYQVTENIAHHSDDQSSLKALPLSLCSLLELIVRHFRLIIALISSLLFFHFSNAQSAVEIIRQSDDLMRGTSAKGIFIIEIIRPKWTREISLKSWSKGDQYSLMLITAPARDAGMGFLKRDNELWNWQPTIDRVIKMPPSMMMQSWMGSDFTNDDLVRESSIVSDYTHRLIGDTVIRSYDTWQIEMIPKEDAAVVWGRVVIYIEKENYYQLLVKYFDEDDFLVNTMVLSDIRLLGDRLLPSRMEMIPADQPEQKTVLTYLEMEFDLDIAEDFFSIQNLKQLN